MGVVLGKLRNGRKDKGKTRREKALHPNIVRREMKRIVKAMRKSNAPRTPGGLPLPPKVGHLLF